MPNLKLPNSIVLFCGVVVWDNFFNFEPLPKSLTNHCTFDYEYLTLLKFKISKSMTYKWQFKTFKTFNVLVIEMELSVSNWRLKLNELRQVLHTIRVKTTESLSLVTLKRLYSDLQTCRKYFSAKTRAKSRWLATSTISVINYDPYEFT